MLPLIHPSYSALPRKYVSAQGIIVTPFVTAMHQNRSARGGPCKNDKILAFIINPSVAWEITTLTIFPIYLTYHYFPQHRAIYLKVLCGAIYDAQTTPQKRALY